MQCQAGASAKQYAQEAVMDVMPPKEKEERCAYKKPLP